MVYPAHYQKKRHTELRVTVNWETVAHYLYSELMAIDRTRVERTGDGVMRIGLGTALVYVCVVEMCAHTPFVNREWAQAQPTCYVAVDASGDRFLPDEWLRIVPLADLLCGTARL